MNIPADPIIADCAALLGLAPKLYALVQRLAYPDEGETLILDDYRLVARNIIDFADLAPGGNGCSEPSCVSAEGASAPADDARYAAAEREHLGDPNAGTGIYRPKNTTLSPLAIAGIAREHFGNPIPREAFAFANDLLAAESTATSAVADRPSAPDAKPLDDAWGHIRAIAALGKPNDDHWRFPEWLAWLTRIANWYPDSEDDSREIWKDAHSPEMRITLGQCRAARAALTSSPPAPVRWVNGCDESVPRALRFLADHERPSHGETPFNSAHLFQLAAEIEHMAAMRLFATGR